MSQKLKKRTHAERRAETRSRLLIAARRSFRERGYAETSMDALCAEAGVTRGALYHNFGGKEGLFEAVVRQLDDEIGERILAAVRGQRPSVASFTAGCVAYLELALDPEIQKIVLQDAPAVLGQRLREIDAEGALDYLIEALAGLMERGAMVSLDPEATAMMINGAMLDSALWIAAQDDAEAALRKATKALRAIIAGLKA